MESIGEREWISLSGTYTAEESDFMANLLNNYCLPYDLNSDLTLEIPSYYNSDAKFDSSNMYTLSQEPLWFPNSASLSLDFSVDDVGNPDSTRKTNQCSSLQDSPNEWSSHLKRKTEETGEDEKVAPMSVKKRSRSLPDVENSKRSGRAPKIPKLASVSYNEDDQLVSPNGHCTSSFSSEDDCNEAQEINGGISSSSNTKGKSRASRGSATDPQSLYARKRRERINERLKILQTLVPNGTKVDISTMLEEAVEYVKFLQLQIKLLSSDDQWMYAPIAYNGMDLGLNLMRMKHVNASQ